MDPEDVVTRPPLPWKGLAIVTASAAVAAVVVNLGIGWLLALPEGASVPGDAGALVASGSDVGAGDGSGVGVTPDGRPLRVPSVEEYRTTILARNLFDHNRIGVVEDDGEGGEGGDDVSNLPVTLRGTIVAEPAELSAAFIEEQGKPSAYAYGIGQTVQGAEILEILDDRVKLLNRGREEWLLLGETTKGSGGTAAAAPITDPAAGMEGVEQKSETEFVVSRSLIDEKLGDLSALTREARALLHRGPDGEYDGYRLSAIRRGSVADMLGIRNGDIIHAVNGLDLNSVEGAMKALDALKTEGGLKFEVTRRGQPVTLSYDIR